jgi:hypothetical protein
MAQIIGCGGSEEEQEPVRPNWRRFRSGLRGR